MKTLAKTDSYEVCTHLYYAAYVELLGGDSPMSHSEEIEKILKENGIVGTVLWDYLTYNESKAHRWVIIEFDGEKFDISSMRPTTLENFAEDFCK